MYSTMTTIQKPKPEQHTHPIPSMDRTLTAHDRCDSCGAQAYVSAVLANGPLLFCGHHFHRYEEKLTMSALTIVNETEFILAKKRVDTNGFS